MREVRHKVNDAELDDGGSAVSCGLPRPLFDEHGFPLPLLRIRERVLASGGSVDGELHHWTIHHPNPELPRIDVHFLVDGDVLIQAGRTMRNYVDATMAYKELPPGSGGGYLAHEIVGILDGGLREYVIVNETGGQVKQGYELKHPYGGIRTGWLDWDVSPDEQVHHQPGWRVHWHQYPAWPEPQRS
jgi:hypothetical protein